MPSRLLVILVALSSCDPVGEATDGGSDAGVTLDAGVLPDSGFVDSGLDAGLIDGGVDAGSIDAGVDAGLDGGRGSDGGASDAGLDAGLRPITWRFPSCLGPSLPLQRAGQLPYVDATIGTGAAAQRVAFLVDFGSTQSWIDLSALMRPAHTSCTATTCSYPDFDFFGSWGQVTMLTGDFSRFVGPPRQAGIIGTDFLSVKPTTMDYRGLRIFSSSGAFCQPAELEDAGFVAMPSTGFYSSNLGALLPLSNVIADAGAGLSVPNVPTLTMRLDGVTALAQLDTGFDDKVVSGSINVNLAFLNDVLMRAPTALQRSPGMDLRLTTCVGVDEPVTAWRVAPGHVLEFVTTDGGSGHRMPSAVLFAKDTPAAARVCGGIGTWTVNGAQVAASHFVSAGAVVFDGNHSTVWMPK